MKILEKTQRKTIRKSRRLSQESILKRKTSTKLGMIHRTMFDQLKTNHKLSDLSGNI